MIMAKNVAKHVQAWALFLDRFRGTVYVQFFYGVVMRTQKCPHCGHTLKIYRNPAPTVDIIIYNPAKGVVLVSRAHEPLGWALPGGFVEYGETLEDAAVREAREETGLDVELEGLVGVYSDPSRDPRQHTITTAFYGRSKHSVMPRGGDDAAEAQFFPVDALPPLVFGHERIIADFLEKMKQALATRRPCSGASVCVGLGVEAARGERE